MKNILIIIFIIMNIQKIQINNIQELNKVILLKKYKNQIIKI